MQLIHASHMHPPGQQAAAGEDTLNLRIAAVFITLVAGLIGESPFVDAFLPVTPSLHLMLQQLTVLEPAAGVVPPLIGSWLSGSPNSVTARVIRAASGGIILALALVSPVHTDTNTFPLSVSSRQGVTRCPGLTRDHTHALSCPLLLPRLQIHIIPESFEQLEGAAGPLPLGGIVIMAGLLVMLALEYVATYISVSRSSRSKHGNSSSSHDPLPTAHHHGHSGAAAAAAAPDSPVHAHDATESCNKLCKTTPDSNNTAAGADAAERATAAGGHHAHAHAHGAKHGDDHHHAVDMVPSLVHSHGCRQQPACHSTALKQQVTCMTFELGCVAHSVVLGLALGVMTDATDMVLTLTVVLAVHQAVEGLAMGSVLAATQRLSRCKKYVLALVYAATLPAGIAGGLLASNSYNPTAPVAVLVQGVANGLSGGLLLYVSMFSLLGAELSQHDLLHRPLLAARLMLAVLCGAAVMCVIGLWA